MPHPLICNVLPVKPPLPVKVLRQQHSILTLFLLAAMRGLRMCLVSIPQERALVVQ